MPRLTTIGGQERYVARVTRLDDGLHCIDLEFQGQPGVIASYLLEEAGERALIEIGPTSTLDTLLEALRSLGVEPETISKVLVTHIHLDHAGAAGTFIKRHPHAQLFVHEIGARHMIDPSKLLASATRIYGDMMEPLWGTFDPVPEENITRLSDDNRIAIGSRHINALYTPGHASHHVSFHDADRGIVFAGDVAVVRMQGCEHVRPATPPPDIDLELWTESLERLRGLHAHTLCLTHFGPFGDVDWHLTETRDHLYEWADIVSHALQSGQDRLTIVDTIRLHADRALHRITNDASIFEHYELAAPLGMSVDGYLRYFKKRAEQAAPSPSSRVGADGHQ